ncbi:MAG: hypothetical protein JJT76_19255 [Clostridiaceae bacterium]|nr:hypothetical protein [Clostridiaceae bacterium]
MNPIHTPDMIMIDNVPWLSDVRLSLENLFPISAKALLDDDSPVFLITITSKHLIVLKIPFTVYHNYDII